MGAGQAAGCRAGLEPFTEQKERFPDLALACACRLKTTATSEAWLSIDPLKSPLQDPIEPDPSLNSRWVRSPFTAKHRIAIPNKVLKPAILYVENAQ